MTETITILLGYRKWPDCGHYEGCFRVIDVSENLDATLAAPGHYATKEAALEAARKHADGYTLLLVLMGILPPEEYAVEYSYMSPN